MTKQFVGAIAGAVLLVCGNAPAFAQSTAKPAKPTARATSTAAPKPPQPAAAAKRVAAPSYDAEPGRVSDYWTIENALPSRSSADRARSAQAPPAIGRVPLQNAPGSIGIASGNIRATEFSDGRPVPGLTQNTHGESSYVGLSVSVPSGNNSFPIPAPPWNGGSSGW